MSTLRYPRTSWFLKFCECTLAAIAIFNILMLPLEYMPRWFWETYGHYFQYSLVGTVVIAVVGTQPTHNQSHAAPGHFTGRHAGYATGPVAVERGRRLRGSI